MTNIERCDRLAFLLLRMECGIGLLDVIYECMRIGKFDTDMFVPAVYATYEYFANLRETLKEFKEEEQTVLTEQTESEKDLVRR